jgi:farnesol dehydrogenase
LKKILVTGATGYLGRNLALRLAREGNLVHALYRTESKIRDWKHENIRFFRGSLGDIESLNRAMEGCTEVYHMAAFASVWTRDSGTIYEENVGGTVNVAETALRQGVDKMVFTSTAGVLGPSEGKQNTEDKQFNGKYITHYDRSKAEAEKRVLGVVSEGLNAVIVSPTRIYGPGSMSKSNALTRIVIRYLEGKWKFIPGRGNSIGNYVFVDDVVDCHLLAMEKGRSGERYLCGGQNLSFNELFLTLERVSGVKRTLVNIPLGPMLGVSGAFLALAHLTGWTPPITPAFVRRYNHDWEFSSSKAEQELGYSPLKFEEGLKHTIKWIQDQHLL